MVQVLLADAVPPIGLARIQQLELLRALFQQVWITPVIAAEIGLAQSMEQSAAFPGSDRLQDACAQGWLLIDDRCGRLVASVLDQAGETSG